MSGVDFVSYGVRIRTLQKEDLEFLRAKRNDPFMRRWMTTDHEITANEMANWFAQLPETSLYVLAEFDGRCVGHLNAKLVSNGVYEPGYMFWDEDFQQSGGTLRAIFAFYNYLFDYLHAEKTVGITACDNRRALRLAYGFGAVKQGEQMVGGRMFVKLMLTSEQYMLTRKTFEHAMA